MRGIEMFEPTCLIKFFQGFVPSFFGADVIAGGKDVAGVDADADRDFFMDTVDDDSLGAQSGGRRKSLVLLSPR